jgi:hypothetical protein
MPGSSPGNSSSLNKKKGKAPRPPAVETTGDSNHHPQEYHIFRKKKKDSTEKKKMMMITNDCNSSFPVCISPTIGVESTQTTESDSISGRKRKSVKSRPAPSPPPDALLLSYSPDNKTVLTRSLSEQRQLNVKNLLNAAPSFRSQVDINAASSNKLPGGEEDKSDSDDCDSLIIDFEEDDLESRREPNSEEFCPLLAPNKVLRGTLFTGDVSDKGIPVLHSRDDLVFFDERGWLNDIPIEIPSKLSAFIPPVPPSDTDVKCRPENKECLSVTQEQQKEGSEQEKHHLENDDEDTDVDESDEEDSISTEGTVNYDCEEGMHDCHHDSHAHVICGACGCHVYHDNFINDILSVRCNNNNNESGKADLNGLSESKTDLASFSHSQNDDDTLNPCITMKKECPFKRINSSRCIHSYRSTFSLQFPTKCSSGKTFIPEAEHPFTDATVLPEYLTQNPDDDLTLKDVARRGKSPFASPSLDAPCADNVGLHQHLACSSSKRTSNTKEDKKETVSSCDLDENLCIYQKDIDFSTVSDNLKALLSPQREWIKCSLCRNEVTWLKKKVIPAPRPVTHVIITPLLPFCLLIVSTLLFH